MTDTDTDTDTDIILKRKEARRAYYKKWYSENYKKYYEKNKDKLNERNRTRAQTESGKAIERKKYENRRKRSPEKIRARQQCRRAVRSGKLLQLPCEVCGDEKSFGHHDDYSKPLDVRWLCGFHHQEYHNNN